MEEDEGLDRRYNLFDNDYYKLDPHAPLKREQARPPNPTDTMESLFCQLYVQDGGRGSHGNPQLFPEAHRLKGARPVFIRSGIHAGFGKVHFGKHPKEMADLCVSFRVPVDADEAAASWQPIWKTLSGPELRAASFLLESEVPTVKEKRRRKKAPASDDSEVDDEEEQQEEDDDDDDDDNDDKSSKNGRDDDDNVGGVASGKVVRIGDDNDCWSDPDLASENVREAIAKSKPGPSGINGPAQRAAMPKRKAQKRTMASEANSDRIPCKRSRFSGAITRSRAAAVGSLSDHQDSDEDRVENEEEDCGPHSESPSAPDKTVICMVNFHGTYYHTGRPHLPDCEKLACRSSPSDGFADDTEDEPFHRTGICQDRCEASRNKDAFRRFYAKKLSDVDPRLEFKYETYWECHAFHSGSVKSSMSGKRFKSVNELLKEEHRFNSVLPFLESEIDPADLTERILNGHVSGFVTIYGGEETHVFDPNTHQQEDFNDGYYSDEEISDGEDLDGSSKWRVKDESALSFEKKWYDRKRRREKQARQAEIRKWLKAPDLSDGAARNDRRDPDESSLFARPLRGEPDINTDAWQDADVAELSEMSLVGEYKPHYLRPSVTKADLKLHEIVPEKDSADFRIQATFVNSDPSTNTDPLKNIGFVPQKDYVDSTELSRYTQAQIAHLVQSRKGPQAITKEDYVKYTSSKHPKTHLRYNLHALQLAEY